MLMGRMDIFDKFRVIFDERNDGGTAYNTVLYEMVKKQKEVGYD